MPARLIVVFDPSSDLVVDLADGISIVGRGLDCAIHVHDELVSRRHCEFVVANSTVSVRDLQSKNGTYVNGLRIGDQTVELKAGDLVAFGHTTLRLGVG